MRLVHIRASHFRNLTRLEYCPAPGLNIFIGENAQGKTNILEAIYALSTTTSFRSGTDLNLVQEQASGYKIEAGYSMGDRTIDSSLRFDKDKGKTLLINCKKTVRNHPDRLRVVLFTPDDLYLVKGSPVKRRSFVDFTLRQISVEYDHQLDSYQNLLKRRNAMLRKNQGQSQTYRFTNSLFIETAAWLILARIRFVNHLQEQARRIYFRLSEGQELKIRYALSFAIDNDTINLDVLKENLYRQEQQLKVQEMSRRMSLIGPHRDDMNIYLDNKPAKIYASQGQQRGISIALKLAEHQTFAQLKGFQPLFLLDEVLAELDYSKRQLLLEELVGASYQSFLTSVEQITPANPDVKISVVKQGSILGKE